jgi:hypothetical protein
VIEHLRVSNVVMQRITRAIECLPYMEGKEGDSSACPEPDDGTPTLRDLAFSGLTLADVQEVARIEGLAERYVHGVRISDVSAAHVKSGVFFRRGSDLRVSGLALERLDERAVYAHSVERLEVHRLSCPRPEPRIPLVHLEQVTGAFVHGCDVAVNGSSFVRLEGDRNQRVNLTGNNLPHAFAADVDVRSRRGG